MVPKPQNWKTLKIDTKTTNSEMEDVQGCQNHEILMLPRSSPDDKLGERAGVPEPSKTQKEHSKTSFAQKCRKVKAQKLLQKFIQTHTRIAIGGFDHTQFENELIQKHRNNVNISNQAQINQDLGLINHEYQKLFKNQTDFARTITQKFKQDTQLFNALACALTQSGKTGTMLALIHDMIQELAVPLQNVFIITGYSSKLWVQQTKQRMPDAIKENIFHRNTLHKFVKHAKNKQNILVITDETHIASAKNQAIHRAFNKLQLFDIDFIYKNNIKLVHFTET